ncbi:MAG: VRR-NUC domain-containing protein [Sphingomonas sp.]|nr:VRR-NUC domain-containing protein [Sphingomonas sp.]
MNAPAIIPTERQTQRAILSMCGRLFPQVWITHIPNGAHLAGNDVARFKQMGALIGDGLKKGTPDMLCLWSPGKGAFLEVKRPKLGKLSEAQRAVQERLESLAWPVAIVTTPEAAYAFLRGCGAPCVGALS